MRGALGKPAARSRSCSTGTAASRSSSAPCSTSRPSRPTRSRTTSSRWTSTSSSGCASAEGARAATTSPGPRGSRRLAPRSSPRKARSIGSPEACRESAQGHQGRHLTGFADRKARQSTPIGRLTDNLPCGVDSPALLSWHRGTLGATADVAGEGARRHDGRSVGPMNRENHLEKSARGDMPPRSL